MQPRNSRSPSPYLDSPPDESYNTHTSPFFEPHSRLRQEESSSARYIGTGKSTLCIDAEDHEIQSRTAISTGDGASAAVRTPTSEEIRSLKEEESELCKHLEVFQELLLTMPHNQKAVQMLHRIEEALQACKDAIASEISETGSKTPHDLAPRRSLRKKPRPIDPGGRFTPPGYWDLDWEWLSSFN